MRSNNDSDLSDSLEALPEAEWMFQVLEERMVQLESQRRALANLGAEPTSFALILSELRFKESD